jgi:hypothetical protein
MNRTQRFHLKQHLALLGLIGVAMTASALELQMSGFGTAGVAVSNRAYRYQRFIDDDGTVKRDSVLGAQADLKLTTELSVTVQAKVAPADDSDDHWKGSLAWAFASWRPNNEWLVRLGKVRLPLYLYSENLDVGQSYDFARMPIEMYSISPTTDIAGLYVTRNWVVEHADLSLDVYTGRAPRVVHRAYLRDSGPLNQDVSTRVSGAVLTLRGEDSTWRAGYHHAESAFNNGVATPGSLVYQQLLPGVGYYGAGPAITHFSNDIVTIGMDWSVNPDWRVVAELERNFQHGIDMGANTVGGYLSALRKFDKLTPYLTWSQLRTVGTPARLHAGLSAVNVPAYIPGADQINAGQRQALDAIPYYDQRSLAFGASYALTPQSKLKAELVHTWVGKGSEMVASPTGGPIVAHEGIDVMSLSYNFAF